MLIYHDTHFYQYIAEHYSVYISIYGGEWHQQASWPCDSVGIDDWCDVCEITVGWLVSLLGIDDMLVVFGATGGETKQLKNSTLRKINNKFSIVNCAFSIVVEWI